MKYPLCEKYGFDAKKRKHYVQLMGLTSKCHLQVSMLHEQIIERCAEPIVEAFYKQLLSFPEITTYLKKHAKIEHLKATQLLYLKSYGIGFDTPEYFEERLQVGQVHAQIKLPLHYYKMAFRIIDEILFDYIAQYISIDNDDFLSMIKLVSKISTLDMSLAIETYHNVKVQSMSSSIKALRDERQSLSTLVDRDDLTQVASRSKIFEYINTNIETSLEDNSSFCVAMIDLDFFKVVNDTYGHIVGDKILKGIADRMKNGLRENDLLGRYGGEEFVLILPHEKLMSAEKILERICEHVAQSPFMIDGQSIPVTVSIGVSDFHVHDSDEDILGRADHALYKAKNLGRNRVVVEYFIKN